MQAIVSGLLVGGVYGLISMGLSLIFGVMRILNFAQGELVMVGMYITFFLVSVFNFDPYVSIFISAPLLLILGIIIQKYFINRVLSDDDLPQLLVTLGISLLLQNTVLFFLSADSRVLDTSYSRHYFEVANLYFNQAQIIAFVIATVCTVFMGFLLNATDLGKALRATVDDNEMAQMVGINSERMYLLSFAIGASLAGIGGSALISYYPATPTVGATFLVIAFVSVVLGGMGNVIGAFVAALIIGVVQQLTATYLAVDMQNVGIFLLFIILLLVKPTGLFGKEDSV